MLLRNQTQPKLQDKCVAEHPPSTPHSQQYWQLISSSNEQLYYPSSLYESKVILNIV